MSKLSPLEKKAVEAYQTEPEINAMLRELQTPSDKLTGARLTPEDILQRDPDEWIAGHSTNEIRELSDHLKALDGAFDKGSVLPADVPVYRGAAGFSQYDPAFLSTSIDPKVAQNFGGKNIRQLVPGAEDIKVLAPMWRGAKQDDELELLLNRGHQIEPMDALIARIKGKYADGGLAHFKDGGTEPRDWTDEEIASMTHERPTFAAPTFADGARSVRDIVADHYKKQALGLARDPLGTASRNVRTVTEIALPVSTLYKAADMATGAEGAEPPDAWDVVGDVGALMGYKAGRKALKTAAPAAMAGAVAMPTDTLAIIEALLQ